MNVLGLDLGLTEENPTGLALVDMENMKVETYFHIPVINVRDDWRKRLSYIALSLNDLISATANGIDLIGYEYPFVETYQDEEGHNRYSFNLAIKLAHVGGMIIAIGSVSNLPVMPVTPIEAKLAVSGDPVAMKFRVRQAVGERFHLDSTNLSFHQADAIAVAVAAHNKWGRTDRENRVEQRDPVVPSY